MASARVKDLLEKTKNYDADERFMAMHDLVEQLKSMQGSIETPLQVKAEQKSTTGGCCCSTALPARCSTHLRSCLPSRVRCRSATRSFAC
jgi:hypothetical protein